MNPGDESAFPQETIKLADDGLCSIDGSTGRLQTIKNGGLTKRELFSAMAMQAIISKTPLLQNIDGTDTSVTVRAAIGAVDYADALISELAKGRE